MSGRDNDAATVEYRRVERKHAGAADMCDAVLEATLLSGSTLDSK